MDYSSTILIQKKGETDLTSHIRTKVRLQQIGEIYCELIKLRDGETEQTCNVRNLLQVFGGEIQIHCSIDVDEEISSIARILDEGISVSVWDKTNEVILRLYEQILQRCSIIYM